MSKRARTVEATRCKHRYESGRRCVLPAHNGEHSLNSIDLPKDVEAVLEDVVVVRVCGKSRSATMPPEEAEFYERGKDDTGCDV